MLSKRSDNPPLNTGQTSVNQGNPSGVYMRLDERKWASTMAKVYRHMKLMEKTKYLEPHFSFFIAPIAQYMMNKYRLGAGATSINSYSTSSGQTESMSNQHIHYGHSFTVPTSNNIKITKNQNLAMDVVMEEDLN